MRLTDARKKEIAFARKLGAQGQRQLNAIVKDARGTGKVLTKTLNAGKADLTNVISIELQATYIGHAGNVLAEPSMNISAADWELVNERAATWSNKYSVQQVKGMDTRTQRKVQNVLGELRDAAKEIGEPIPEFFTRQTTLGTVRSQLQPVFGAVRSELIASTELTRAAYQGELAVIERVRANGFAMLGKWATSTDERTCPICDGLNNSVLSSERQENIGLDGSVTSSVRGDPRHGTWNLTGIFRGKQQTLKIAGPPAHPRCRCWVNYELQTIPLRPSPLAPAPVSAPLDTALTGAQLLPRGTQVREGFKVPTKRSWMGESVQDSLDAIDETHGDGDLNAFNLGDLKDKPMPVTSTQSTSYLGQYRFRGNEGKKFEMSNGGSAVPKTVEGRAGIANTFTHEVGHRLDNTTLADMAAQPIIDEVQRSGYVAGMTRPVKRMAIGNDRAQDGLLSWTNAGSGRNGQFFASTTSPDLEDWRKAVSESDALKTLTDMHHNPLKHVKKEKRPPVEWRGDDMTLHEVEFVKWRPDPAYIHYLRDAAETFARSYNQYVATRSGNAEMLKQLYAVAGKDAQGGYATQWTAKEFEPIAKTFDELFEKIGWVEKAS